jgi:outer membrane receptor protein involved in Fe transport
MRRWVVVSSLLLVSAIQPPPAHAAKPKVASARELLKAGFFQDFEELDLESLLDTSDVMLRVAARKEEGMSEAAGVVSVLSGDEIRNMGATNLVEALRAVPGVDVVTDSLGRPRVCFRDVASGTTGGGSENVLILMNGQRIDDPLFGGATLMNPALPVANIKRIEILRGAGSALFGSGAVSGVVDIITFDPEDFSGIEASVEAGSFGTQRYGLKVGSQAGSVQTFGYIQFEDVNGARVGLPADSRTPFHDSLTPARTLDGIRGIESNYTATWRDLEAHFRVSNVRNDGFIGLVDALGDKNNLAYRQLQGDLNYGRALQQGTLRLTLSFLQNRYRELLQPLPPGFVATFVGGFNAVFPAGVFAEENANSRRYGAEAVWERPLGAHQLVGGLGLGRESAFDFDVKSSYDFSTRKAFEVPKPLDVGPSAGRTLFSAFLQDSWSPTSRVALTGGLRFDRIGDATSQVSPRAVVVFSLPQQTKLKLLYGRAFRAPTFAERDAAFPVLDANATLDPMHVDTLEAALSLRRQHLRLGAAVYATFLRDAIATQGAFSTTRSRAVVNLPGTDIRGLELEGRRTFGVGGSLFANYAYQHAELRSSGGPLPGAPNHLGNLGATFALGEHFRATPYLSFRSSRPRAAGDTRAATAGYGLASVAIQAVNVKKTLSFSLSAQNIFDKRYFDPSPALGVPGDYPRPGRRILVGASYQF